MGGGSPKVVHTLGGGLAKGVLGVYKGGGWVKKVQKRAYVICTQPLVEYRLNPGFFGAPIKASPCQ